MKYTSMMALIASRRARFSRPFTLLIAALLTACGSGDDQQATSNEPQNQPPAWSDAPTDAVSIGQGQTITIPLTLSDPDAEDTPTATIDPATITPGIEAEISPDGAAISVHAGYMVEGPSTFIAAIEDGRGGRVEVTVSLTVKPLLWLGTSAWTAAEGPVAREHGAFIVDAAKKRAILIGGSGYQPQGTPLGDAWQYDIETSAWSMLAPTGDVPPPAGSRRVAPIPGKAEAYLFGGYGESSVSNKELYRVTFDGDEPVFTLVTQISAPPARSLHMFAYDAQTNRFFVFGGYGTKVLGDTWVMQFEGEQAVWTKLTLPESPSPRYGFFYGVDDVNGRVILFSGAQGTASINAARDTWALDMRSEPPAWALVSEGDAVPPGRRNGCAIFDPSGPRLFVFGGTSNGMTTEPGLFAFDARPMHPGWSTLALDGEPALRSSGMGFYDPLSGRTLLGFGNDAKVYQDLSTLGY